MSVPAPVLVRASELNAAPYNPRSISAEEMERLKGSILAHDMVEAIVVRREGMQIIGGHQRVRALLELHAAGAVPSDEIWAFVRDVGDREARRLNVALNRIGGDFDPFMLGELFASLGEVDEAEIAAMGFAEDEFQAALDAVEDPEEAAARLEEEAGDLAGFERKPMLTIEFLTVEVRDEVKASLRAAGDDAGDYLARLIRADAAARPTPAAAPVQAAPKAPRARKARAEADSAPAAAAAPQPPEGAPASPPGRGRRRLAASPPAP